MTWDSHAQNVLGVNMCLKQNKCIRIINASPQLDSCFKSEYNISKVKQQEVILKML